MPNPFIFVLLVFSLGKFVSCLGGEGLSLPWSLRGAPPVSCPLHALGPRGVWAVTGAVGGGGFVRGGEPVPKSSREGGAGFKACVG